MPTATINGIEIAYTDQGSGTPLVLIHGYPLNRRMWDPQVEGLSDAARVIAIDLRGHGESQAPFWLTTVDTYADDVRGLMDHLGIDKAVIGGFSMGGYVAFAFLRKYPERVRGLILADTRAQPDAPEGKAARFQSALTAQQRGPGAIAEAMIGRLLSQKSMDERPELVARVRAIMESTPVQGMAGDLMAMAERPDSVPMLASISVPTLVIVGEADGLTPPADSQLMAERIPGAKLEIIPGAAHLSNMEEPEHFNRVVREFLAHV
ncbi:MAG TPA: alpha/beta fold hydrolase [Dehalococcoidia bacterium]|nr:alpha/beta fold hydrolase [Dehalococcoidia bacterium]